MADASKPKADDAAEEPKSIGETAADYLIPMSDAAKTAWQGKEAAFQQYAIDQAKGLFPTLAPQLDQGLTTKTLVDPYVQIAKSVLGPSAQPDWTDPMWTKALDGGFDPITKRPAPMALSQWITTLHNGPNFDQSPQANQQAQGFAGALHSAFTAGQ